MQVRGREALKQLVAIREESVLTLYGLLKQYYPDLLTTKYLSNEQKNRYNSLVNANVYNINVRRRVLEK